MNNFISPKKLDPHWSNIELRNKAEVSREKIKKNANNLFITLTKEREKWLILAKKKKMNELCRIIHERYLEKIDVLREVLATSWALTLRKNDKK